MKNELYHHGVKGQRWGVRRYQNEDGTLTAAGRKRAQKDLNSLSKAMSKHMDSTNDYQRSLKRTYFVDEKGNNRWDEKGNGYFDGNGGIYTHDINKYRQKNINEQSYLNIKKVLQQKYDDVVVKASYNINTGEAFSKIILSKNGEQFVSEFTKNYGEFDTSKQIDFKRMFK